jgi:hypothetical protein
MNRNSSFFWASDAFRDTEVEDEQFVEDVGLSWDNDDVQIRKPAVIDASTTTVIQDEEAQPLVKNVVPSYGKSSLARENVTLQRRDDEYRTNLFPHREARPDPSQKGPLAIRKKETLNTVLRFQVV